jgi:serine/threonine protein kinase
LVDLDFLLKVKSAGKVSFYTDAISLMFPPVVMATLEDRKDFLDEIEMMKQIGKHLNVVSMLGCVTQGGPLCLITEYCRYGNLKLYLRSIRDKVTKLS